MAVKNYLSIDGEILGEYAGNGERGNRTMYIRDAVGSVVETVGTAGNVLNQYHYKPFGEMAQKTGSSPDPRFLWCGSYGYRANPSTSSFVSQYVRARHYSYPTATWTSRDPLWPNQMPYGYVNGKVPRMIDYWGKEAAIIMTGAPQLTIVQGGGHLTLVQGGAVAPSPVVAGGQFLIILAGVYAVYDLWNWNQPCHEEGILTGFGMWLGARMFGLDEETMIAADPVTAGRNRRKHRNNPHNNPNPLLSPGSDPDGGCNPCPNPPNPQVDIVPPKEPHFIKFPVPGCCNGDHAHPFVYDQDPYPSCKCHLRKIEAICLNPADFMPGQPCPKKKR